MSAVLREVAAMGHVVSITGGRGACYLPLFQLGRDMLDMKTLVEHDSVPFPNDRLIGQGFYDDTYSQGRLAGQLTSFTTPPIRGTDIVL